jgi:hypothetical protein
LLNDQWVTEEIRVEIKKFLDSNKNENILFQNVWDTVLRRKFTALNAYIFFKKITNKQTNDAP